MLKIEELGFDRISIHIKHAKQRAAIRRWTYFPTSAVISYDISRARYCERIGREHKSNGVYFIVNLETGCYYQKCYDPECRTISFKSTELHLPLSLIPFKAAPLLDENHHYFPKQKDLLLVENNICNSSDDEDFCAAALEICSAAEEGVLDRLICD
eukprot:gene316-3685_t